MALLAFGEDRENVAGGFCISAGITAMKMNAIPGCDISMTGVPSLFAASKNKNQRGVHHGSERLRFPGPLSCPGLRKFSAESSARSQIGQQLKRNIASALFDGQTGHGGPAVAGDAAVPPAAHNGGQQ